MPINFGAISTTQATRALVDPRDIFNALPSKPAEMNFLRGPQDQVLEKWFARRDQRDVVVKLNTGGGKTVVGLLMAKAPSPKVRGRLRTSSQTTIWSTRWLRRRGDWASR